MRATAVGGRGVRATDPVFLIRTRDPRPTYYAMHDMARLTHTSCTMLVAFAREADARAWARSMHAHKREHGAYPAREFRRQTRHLAWVRDDAGDDDATGLDVVPMPFTDALAMLKGTGANCRLLHDIRDLRHRTDVMQPFDKAAVCTRLEHDLSLRWETPCDS